jgi:dihydropteroate synthase
MVNDVGGGELDPKMLQTVGELGLPYVAMCPACASTEEVIEWFRDFTVKAEKAGIKEWILDPGFGFGKTLDQNYEVLDGLDRIVSAFSQPVMAAVSRKSMIYKKLGIGPEEAMPATQVIQFAALQKGATWLRVHDVLPAVHTARLYSTMYMSSPGAAK